MSRTVRYCERVNGLFKICENGDVTRIGPLSMSDDILANLHIMDGVEIFDFGGTEAPTHLITGFHKSLKVLRLDNWSGLSKEMVKELADMGIECYGPGGCCAWGEVHGHFFIPEYPYMRPGKMPLDEDDV